MWRCHAITLYPDRANSFAVCVGVVACNHLVLSLREGAHGPTSMARATSFPRRTTGVVFAAQSSNATLSYVDQLQTISLPKSTDWNRKQGNLGQKQGTWHEMRPSRGSRMSSE